MEGEMERLKLEEKRKNDEENERECEGIETKNVILFIRFRKWRDENHEQESDEILRGR